MDDILRLFGVFLAMGGAGALIYGAVAFIGVGVKRMERGLTDPSALAAELEELRARVADGEGLQQRVAELEERLDFAERMLTQRAEPGALPERGSR